MLTFTYCMCLFSACSLFQKQEPKLDYPPIWEYDFNVGLFSSIDPILYKDKVIYSGLDEKKNDFSANSTLEAFDKKNGKPIWVWDEGNEQDAGQFNPSRGNYVSENILHISTGVDYAINLNDGSTIDYYAEPKVGGQDFSGYNDVIISDFYNDQLTNPTLSYTNTKNFNWKVVSSYFSSDTLLLGFSQPVFKNNEMIIPLMEWNPIKKILRMYLEKYNLTNMTLYSKMLFSDNIFDSSPDYPPLLINDCIYISLGGKIAAVGINNAQIVWVQNVKYNASRSGIMYADGQILVNTEFQLYALDAETGAINWQIDSSAGGRMQHHKGVVYYNSGTTLRGVDMANGEILLDIEAPSRTNNSNAFFQGAITIDKENDRIYTASYTHAYCYPTLR